MAIFKFIAYSIIAVFVLITLTACTNPSTTYECDGQLWDRHPAAGGKLLKDNHKLFAKLIEHRWWISLLWEYRWTLWIEPKGGFKDYYNAKEIGDVSVAIYEDDEEVGDFSQISKKLYIKTKHGTFIGYCKLN